MLRFGSYGKPAKSAAKAMRGRIARPKRFTPSASRLSRFAQAFGVPARPRAGFLFGALAPIRSSLRASAKRNYRRRKAGPIHRHSVTERSGVFARITNVIQFLIPTLDVGAVRCFFAARDGNVTILGECEKGRFARERNRRCPVR